MGEREERDSGGVARERERRACVQEGERERSSLCFLYVYFVGLCACVRV